MDTKYSNTELDELLAHLERTSPLSRDDMYRLLRALIQETQELRAETQQLRATLALQEERISRLRTPQRVAPRNEELPPVQPPMQRSLEYWAAHIPDFGEDLTEEDIQQHLA